MSYLKVLETKKGFKDYISKSPSIDKKWGETDKVFITTDTAVKYLIYLLEEKSDPNNKYSMTSSITTNPQTPENYIPVQARLLVDTYLEILKKTENMKGIYTVLSANDGKTTMNHQNWLCLDIEKKKLVRFEPSSDFEEFQTSIFCELVIKLLNRNGYEFKYVIADKGQVINSFMGCRAMSTMLASMYIMNIPLSNTSILRKKSGEGDIRLLQPFVYLMQEEIRSCRTGINLARSSRSNKLPFITIGKV